MNEGKQKKVKTYDSASSSLDLDLFSSLLVGLSLLQLRFWGQDFPKPKTNKLFKIA